MVSRLTIAFLALALLPGMAQATVKVMVIGDTLLSGFGVAQDAQFTRELERYSKSRGYEITVVDRSVGGERLKNVAERMISYTGEQADIALLALGMNDMRNNADPERELRYYLENIVYALERTGTKVVLAGAAAPAGLPKEQAAAYAKAYYLVAIKQKVPLYPQLTAGVAGQESMLQEDRYHPNAEGIKTMVRQVFPLLEPLIRWKQAVKAQQPKQQ